MVTRYHGYTCQYLDDVPPARAVHEDAGLVHQLVRPRPGEARQLLLAPLAVEQSPGVRGEVRVLKQTRSPELLEKKVIERECG